MPLFNMSEAARLAGKNRATIARHIKQGRLTATRDGNGNITIDMAELMRVYGELKSDGATNEQLHSRRKVAPSISDKDALIATLTHSLEEARDREKWLRERVAFLEQAALPPGVNIEVRKGFWGRLSQLFGK